MLIEATSLPNGSTLTADVCIVGGGPAGMTIARELGRAGVRVCLLESGGRKYSEETQRLGRLARGEGDLAPPNELRRRQLGGTANIWSVLLGGYQRGVRYLPLDAIDFEARPWVPDGGWPLSRADLDPYYRRAHEVCRIGPYTYEATDWETPRARRLPLDPQRVRTTIEQIGSPRVFTRVYADELARSGEVTVVTHANCGELQQRADTGAVEQLMVDCLDGKRHRVLSRHYVLAAGGIENARLLLGSPGREGGGVGNEHDLVGRYFTDHHFVYGGTVTPLDRALFDQAALYDVRRSGSVHVGAKLQLHHELMREESLLNAAALLMPKAPAERARAVQAVHRLRNAARRRRVGREVLRDALEVGRHVPFVALTGAELALRQRRVPPAMAAGWSSLSRKPHRFVAFEVMLQTELMPHAENRVVLDSELDAFGRPLAAVEWRWQEQDLRSLRRTLELLAEEFARSGLATMQLPPADRPPEVSSAAGTAHHIGTTRMHADPTRGVVDPNARVHGVENLYVAGSSIFPTGGYANPTLTIVALSLRLADHLRGVMGTR